MHEPTPVLIADDDTVTLRILEQSLTGWGYAPVCAADGDRAWEILSRPAAPRLAILDWQMPGRSGVDVCRLAQAELAPLVPYIVLLTVRDQPHDLVEGLTAGANDYLTKPPRPEELQARLLVARRSAERQAELAKALAELEKARATLACLNGVLPTCSWCRKIRREDGSWQPLEVFLRKLTGTRFGHGICPDCHSQVMKEVEAEIRS